MARNRPTYSRLAKLAVLLACMLACSAAPNGRALKQVINALSGTCRNVVNTVTNTVVGTGSTTSQIQNTLNGATVTVLQPVVDSPVNTYDLGLDTPLGDITASDLAGNRLAPIEKRAKYQDSPDPKTAYQTGPFAGEKPNYLYVWNAYGQSYTEPLVTGAGAKDFLLAVDLNPFLLDGTSPNPNYGKYIGFTRLPSIGNEPHHLSINYKRGRLLGGGLLSFLQRQYDLFLFDISEQRNPVFKTNQQLLTTAVTDHVFGLRDGGFVTTQMGSKIGGTPGGLSVWDDDLTKVTVYAGLTTENVPIDGFNPHGADVKAKDNLFVNSDFVNPVSTVSKQAFKIPTDASGQTTTDALSLADIQTRSTVRVWDFNNLAAGIKATVNLPNSKGIIDIKEWGNQLLTSSKMIVPGSFIQSLPDNDGVNLAYATGVFSNNLFLVNASPKPYKRNGQVVLAPYTAKEVIQFSNQVISVRGKSYQLPDTVHPYLLAPAVANVQGSPFFLSLNAVGYFLFLDTSTPERPVILDIFKLPATPNPAAPHYITPINPSLNNRYVAFADYFLDQGGIGAVHAGGNKRVYVLRYNNDAFEIDESGADVLRKPLILDIGADWYGRPHGIATNNQYTDVDTQT